jgi:hypothetical protein
VIRGPRSAGNREPRAVRASLLVVTAGSSCHDCTTRSLALQAPRHLASNPALLPAIGVARHEDAVATAHSIRSPTPPRRTATRRASRSSTTASAPVDRARAIVAISPDPNAKPAPTASSRGKSTTRTMPRSTRPRSALSSSLVEAPAPPLLAGPQCASGSRFGSCVPPRPSSGQSPRNLEDPERTPRGYAASARRPLRTSIEPPIGQPGLTKDTSPRTGRQVVPWVAGNRDVSPAGRVFELPMTAAGALHHPAVRFEELERVANLRHGADIRRRRLSSTYRSTSSEDRRIDCRTFRRRRHTSNPAIPTDYAHGQAERPARREQANVGRQSSPDDERPSCRHDLRTNLLHIFFAQERCRGSVLELRVQPLKPRLSYTLVVVARDKVRDL